MDLTLALRFIAPTVRARQGRWLPPRVPAERASEQLAAKGQASYERRARVGKGHSRLSADDDDDDDDDPRARRHAIPRREKALP